MTGRRDILSEGGQALTGLISDYMESAEYRKNTYPPNGVPTVTDGSLTQEEAAFAARSSIATSLEAQER